MSEYFPKPKSSGGNVKVELDLSTNAIKAALKNATGVDTSKFTKKVNLANLKSEFDKLDVGEVETTPVDLCKLSDAVKEKVVKKTPYDELIRTVNAIQSGNASNLVKKADWNTKVSKNCKRNT